MSTRMRAHVACKPEGGDYGSNGLADGLFVVGGGVEVNIDVGINDGNGACGNGSRTEIKNETAREGAVDRRRWGGRKGIE